MGWDLRSALTVVGIVALSVGAGSSINLLASPVQNAATDPEGFIALLPDAPRNGDIRTKESRIHRINLVQPYDAPGMPFAEYRDSSERDDPAVLNGELLKDCAYEGGFASWFKTIDADLVSAGYAGTGILSTDLYSLYWLYGPFRMVRGAAPWYYDGAPGVADADYILVPLCPLSEQLRRDMLTALDEEGWTLREVRRTELYVLLAPSRAESP